MPSPPRAHPGRACIAVTGSDGFAKVMAELLTAVQYRLPVKVVVSNVSSLGRRLRAGDNGRGGGPADFATWARANGALGIRVEHAAEVVPAVRQAFSAPGPALVDVLVNPEEPRPAMPAVPDPAVEPRLVQELRRCSPGARWSWPAGRWPRPR